MSCPLASWSANTNGQSPCTVVQTVDNSCSPNPAYGTISPPSTENSFVPTGANVTLCTCSWASYNLLSACMLCATESPTFVSWDSWITNCGSLASTTTYFPWDEGKWLPSNESIIPYYASYNPSNYQNGIFNATVAHDTANTNYPPLNGSPLPLSASSSSGSSSSSSSTPVGAIVGGVVGGTVLLLLLCGFVFFIICRKRRRAAQFPPKMTPPAWNGSHFALATKETTHAPLAPSGYPQTSAPMSTTPYAIHSNHIRNAPSVTSLHSLHITSPTSPGHAMPLSPLMPSIAVLSPVSDAADIITPFLATQPSSRPGTPDRKSAQSHSEPPPERATSPQSQRSRMNPPPYTPSSPTSSNHTHNGSNSSRRLSVMRHFRREGGSGDTTISSVVGQRRPHAPRMQSAASAESARSHSTAASVSDNGRSMRTTLERTTTTAASSSRRPAV